MIDDDGEECDNCEFCGAVIYDANVEAFELTGQLVCASCADDIFEEDTMTEEMQQVRDQALRDASAVVMRARMGEIDSDFRCLINRIESMIGKPEAPEDD